MGLPTSGKTTLAEKLVRILGKNGYSVKWDNADKIRKEFNDWDFSEEGRKRQAKRMSERMNDDKYDICIADFVCPKEEYRKIVNPDYLIFMDTIKESCYKDTNSIFERPQKYDLRICFKDSDYYAGLIYDGILYRLRRFSEIQKKV